MRSIRARLILWYVVVLSVTLAGFYFFLYWNLESSLYRESDRLAQDKVALVSTWIDLNAGNLTGQIEKTFKPAANHLLIQLLDLEGKVLGSSLNLDEPLPLSVKTRHEVLVREEVVVETVQSRNGETVRLATYPKWGDAGISGFAQVGVSLSAARRSLQRLLLWFLVTAPGALGVSLLGGYFLINRLLQPVAAITQAAKKIGSDGLSKQRLAIDNPQDELGQLAQTFNKMLDQLEAAFSAQQRFVADAAHELRTPLTVLRGEIEVALRRTRSPEEYQEVLHSNLEEIERLSRLTNNLLTLARADAGEPIVYAEPFDCSALCHEVCEKLVPWVQKKEVELHLDCEEGVLLVGDRGGIERVIANLAENAIKYSPRGEQVRVSLCRADEQVKLVVADTGVGIPQEELPHIFERFYRVDKARTRSLGGSGLGLAIVKTVVEAHKGRIEVTSEIGKGSTFTVWLLLR